MSRAPRRFCGSSTCLTARPTGCRAAKCSGSRSAGRIVRQPKIFLMDEPLSNLDAKLRELLRAELKDLKNRLGATFLFVTHDQVEAMSMGDRIAVLNPGRVVQVGTPQDIYGSPRDILSLASWVRRL